MKQLDPSSFVDAPVATTLYTNGEFVVGQSASDWFAWRPGEPSLQWRHERQASLTGNNVSAVGETQVTSMLDQGPARETTYESRDLRTGELLWTMRSDLRAGRQGLYHHGDQILLRGSSEQGYFLARHRAEDGTELSRVEAPAGEVVVVLGQTVFFGSAKGLYVLRETGAERVQRLAVGWPVAVGKHLVVPMAAIAGATKLFVRWFDESGTELAHIDIDHADFFGDFVLAWDLGSIRGEGAHLSCDPHDLRLDPQATREMTEPQTENLRGRIPRDRSFDTVGRDLWKGAIERTPVPGAGTQQR